MASSNQHNRSDGTRTSARAKRAELRATETLPPDSWGYVEPLNLDGSHARRARARRRTRDRL